MSKVVRSPANMAKIAGLCLGLLLAVGNLSTAKAALSPVPESNVRSFYDTLLITMKSGPTLGERGRYAQLAPIVQQLFDVPYMAQLAVGPSWASLSPAQRQQVTYAFGHYIAATYADRFGSYSGEQLQVLGERPLSYGTLVQTRIIQSDGQPVTINYLMHQKDGTWQVADIYLDGTISQLATQRSEFSSILRDRGVSGLISALNRKVDLLTRSASGSS
ncbi:MAG TPA: ABC transporter substrate-binding protein [Stellaceae bacterium]|nr:ABC transporter substrate-binding protein [Stellaceae bacterium]